jgi:glycosyltransferase involved in cell wall biosynthesis
MPGTVQSELPERTELPVVLHVRVVRGAGGGPEKTILNSPRFLASLGFDARCAYMRAPHDAGFEQIVLRAAELAAPLVEIDDRGPFDPRVVTQLLRICRRQKVAIWHGHDYKSNALGLLLRRFHPMKLVTTVHGWVKFTRRTPLYYSIDRFAMRYYDRVVAVSDDLHDRCLIAGIGEERCLVMKNAIDCQQYARTQTVAEAKRLLGIPPERFLIGAVGRLSAEKGFLLLIRAVDRLLRAGYDVALVIVGEGDQQAGLAAQIVQLDQSKRIQLLGYRADVLAIYEAIDCFALSSLREGLPNVLLEAMAVGVPVVSSRVAGVPSVVSDNETGLLVAPGDENALFEKLQSLQADKSLQSKLGRAGQALIARDFSFQQRMERMAEVYNEVLETKALEPRR